MAKYAIKDRYNYENSNDWDKRIPSWQGSIEIVVEQLAACMVQAGHSVDVYNRKEYHVSVGENDVYLAKKEFRDFRM